jgi:hypothetical protein
VAVTDSWRRGSVGHLLPRSDGGQRGADRRHGLSGIAAAGNNFKSVDFFGNPDTEPEKALHLQRRLRSSRPEPHRHGRLLVLPLKDQIVSVPANIVASAVAGTGNGSQAVNCASPLRSLITFNNGNACRPGRHGRQRHRPYPGRHHQRPDDQDHGRRRRRQLPVR